MRCASADTGDMHGHAHRYAAHTAAAPPVVCPCAYACRSLSHISFSSVPVLYVSVLRSEVATRAAEHFVSSPCRVTGPAAVYLSRLNSAASRLRDRRSLTQRAQRRFATKRSKRPSLRPLHSRIAGGCRVRSGFAQKSWLSHGFCPL